jgi:hypothetical protein
MEKDHILHNVKLIKNNVLISKTSKEEVEKMVKFLLEDAKSDSDMKYVVYRLESAKNQDAQLDNSAAFEEIYLHAKKAAQ